MTRNVTRVTLEWLIWQQ